VDPPAYRTVKRRLPAFAKDAVRQALSKACATHAQLGPASLVLYDVSTLHFETDVADPDLGHFLGAAVTAGR